MQVKIHSGDVEIVDSGTVFSYGNLPVEIVLKEIDGSNSDFKVSFEFSYDDENKTVRTNETKVDDDRTFALRLINYRNSLGQGMLTPFQIASNGNGNCLFLAFMVSSWGDNLSKKIDYTIFKRHLQEKENG